MSKALVITGASKGIGLATATHFAGQGYRVINMSRTPCHLPEVQNLPIDLMQSDWTERWRDELLENLQGIDQIALVHNAAQMTKDTVRDITADSLAASLQLNVIAAAQLNTLLLPQMSAGSSIVYISSTLGQKAVANTHAYVISKHAVIGQMRATCQDLVGSQIHTACVCPGFTETEMLKEHLGKNPDLMAEITAMIAHGRLVQPDEIAATIWFCATNPVINGAIIDANLGQVER